MALLPTFDELQAAARAEIQLRRPDLTDWTEGSVLDAMSGAAAVLADEVIRVNVEQFAELFFDTATNEALDRLALDRFGPVLGVRKLATASIGLVRWTRDQPGPYTILAGTRIRATVGTESVTVQSTSAVSVLSSDTSVLVPVQATVAGRSSNAAAGQLTQILDSVGADPLATCTNPQALAGGTDRETDEQFRERLRRIYSTLRRGTTAALATGALLVPGVSIVTVDESFVEDSGWVYVYVGDPDARSNDTLASLVRTELRNWRAAGAMVEVRGSVREEVPVRIRVAIEAGADREAIAAAIRSAVVAYGLQLDPNERGRPSRIEKASHDANALVVAVEVETTAAQLRPSQPHHAIRFASDQIALAFTEV